MITEQISKLVNLNKLNPKNCTLFPKFVEMLCKVLHVRVLSRHNDSVLSNESSLAT